MTVREFKLPDVGEGVAEGELVRWLVAPGDPVSEDQPVAEVETDKALVEIPSPYDGTVGELRAEAGEVVPVGTVIITFDVADEEAPGDAEPTPEPGDADADADAGAAVDDAAVDDAGAGGSRGGRVFAPPSARRLARRLGVELAQVPGSGPGGRVTEADVRAAAESGGAGDRPEPRTPAGGRPAVRERGDAGAAAGGTGAGAGSGAGTGGEVGDDEPGGAAPAGRERTLATPATRRIAREEGVDVDDVPAVEERDGEAYVTEAAVREYAAAQRAAQVADAEAVAGGAASGEAPGAPEPRGAGVDAAATAATETGARTGAAEGAEGEPATGAADGESRPSGERVPYRGVRRTIGEAMERSKEVAPHVTHTDVADVTALAELREELKPLAAEADVRLTYTPFVMKACVAALARHPYLNAMLDEEAAEIVLRDEYHLGVATATDVGLMVPVVRDVDAKGLAAVARETNDVVERARERTVTREELRGSTFTLTNFGVIGGEYATPILNHPEVAILGLGAIEERPRVVDGEVVPRTTLPLSLTIDHRVVDGAVAARFTNTLIEFLERPKRLLLE
jgi:pyruvate dehydrogenase E2 component (dihydrolipoamide acetyltransferase)